MQRSYDCEIANPHLAPNGEIIRPTLSFEPTLTQSRVMYSITEVELASVSGAIVSRILDEKTGKYIVILKTLKDVRTIDETEGLLAELNERLNEEGIDTPDLVKKVWKTSE